MKTILVLALLLSANASFASVKVKSSLGQTLKELFIQQAQKKGSFVNRAIPSVKSEKIDEEAGEYFGPEAKDIQATDLQVVIARSYVIAFAGEEGDCRLLTVNSKPRPSCRYSATVYLILSQTQGDPGGNSFSIEGKTTIFAVDVTSASAKPDYADYKGELDVSNFRLVKP